MQVRQPAFAPGTLNTVSLSVTTTSGNVQIQPANNAPHVRVVNTGTKVAYIEFGSANTVSASATASMPILGGTSEIFSCAYPYIAAICGGSDSTTLFFTTGSGI